MWATQIKDVSKNEKPKSIYAEMFENFTSSSTIHGTYFWGYSSGIVKLFWFLVVISGMSGAIFIIDNSFKAWESNPVITAVAQIPIEEVPFPSITICPLDSTKFGYMEDYLNSERDSSLVSAIPLQNLFLDAYQILRVETEAVPEACMETYCGNQVSAACPKQESFKNFYKPQEGQEEYEKRLSNNVFDFVKTTFADFNYDPDMPVWKKADSGTLTCQRAAKDFFAFEDFKERFSESVSKKSVYPGSLLRWVYVNSRGTIQDKRLLYDKYLRNLTFAYTHQSGPSGSDSMTWPELVEVLSQKDDMALDGKGDNFRDMKFNEDLFKVMRLSQHPPHLQEDIGFGGRTYTPTFIYCWYDKERSNSAGAVIGPYGERYCDQFQTTFNENGLCYTYNNVDLGKFSAVGRNRNMSSEFFEIRKVKGCGKSKGLRVILDSHNMAHKPKGYSGSRGFMVYVTVAGVVTHKVPFIAQPSFNGEYDFNIHGLHFIDSSEEFRRWNKEKKACGFPTDKELSYLSQFSKQDNCLLECKLKKLSQKCGCSPWYLNQTELPVCGVSGGKCFIEGLSSYTDDLIDIGECNCKTDCEMTHFFTSMGSFPFSDRSATDIEEFFDYETKTGYLSNYLLDPQNYFTDKVTDKLTESLHNLNKTQLALKRFESDIIVLNLFFDTPIITRITLKMRITIFDQISAFGGTMGLFTGVSLVTFVEVAYWLLRLITISIFRPGTQASGSRKNSKTPPTYPENGTNKLNGYGGEGFTNRGFANFT